MYLISHALEHLLYEEVLFSWYIVLGTRLFSEGKSPTNPQKAIMK